MKKRLGDIASIRSGFQARIRMRHDPAGKFRLVQMKDINDDHSLNLSSAILVNAESVRDSHLLKQGDILFRSKGHNNYATVVNGDTKNTTATNHFFILKPKDNSVMPEYLAWYINQPPVQRHIDKNAAGTAVRLVRKQILEAIEIPVPSLPEQRRIVHLFELIRREKELLTKIRRRREEFMEAALMNQVKATA